MTWRNDQVSQPETEKILEVARECLARPGDFVEMGCYKGDTALLVAGILPGDKRLYIYDSFEGLPEKSVEDVSALGEDFKGGELSVTKREVKERFLRAGLRVPVIKKAWFSDLTDEDMPDRIAFSFLDGDFYESIRDSLKLVGPRMVGGSVMIIHDYNNLALPGVKRAVDEWACGKTVEKSAFQSMMIVRF
ncbi:class I SAM-dependent methyltransferase [Candidatus Saccharibacteria bacterium]|nr:class I SAM-dependent methyltransferase [Candidatus Saccharibacteria bacterium]